ncbi:MAG: sugar phosphate nucleotidyltransferase [Candidatus Zipacnadales bacterium]
MKGVILAAGLGTRMRPLTYRRPKPLVPVLDRPMIEHIICGAIEAGVTELLLVIGYRGEMVREVIGDGARFGITIHYASQEKPAGTGDAALMAADFVGSDPFFLSWGDIIISPHNYARVGQVWRNEKPDLLLTLNWVQDPFEGAAVYVENERVVRIIEKPPRGTSTTNYNNAGIFILPAEIMQATREIELSARGERELPDAIQLMLSRGTYVRGLPIKGCWSDVARPAEIIRLNGALLQENSPSAGAIIATSAQIADDASLHLPYILAEGVWCGGRTVIGPSTFLLQDVSVGVGCQLRHCLVLRGARIEDNCELEWSVVEEECVVPAGTCVRGTASEPAFLGS